MELTAVTVGEYPFLIGLWEASVRATHDFLLLKDVLFYKERLPLYLSAVRLTAARDGSGRIVAFMGTHEANIEMLFVDPLFRGEGVGARLVRYAIAELHCNRVDVNEQNGQAVGFYEHMGFRRSGRSELDPEGRPYPILHLKLPSGVAGLRNNL